MNASSELIVFDSVNDLAAALADLSNAFFVTDRNVAGLYPQLLGKNAYVMAAGEDAKTLATVADICRAMLGAGCDRGSVVAAVGGGVVGDTAGFAAACYMRGVSWVSVPTTLLAQVDSGIGGKTGVNIDDYKNIAGAFHLPRRVLLCPDVLPSLPPREWLCGLGEIVKTAFLDADVFAAVYPALPELIRREPAAVAAAVRACATFKQQVVDADFTEQGRRKILNLGHTVGHALEKVDAHRRSHGEYVLWGMLAESFAFADALRPETARRLQDAVRSVLQGCAPPAFDPAAVAAAAAHDKKNDGDRISCMLAADVGRVQELFTDRARLTRSLADWQGALLRRAVETN